VNSNFLVFLGISIVGVVFALMATYPEYRGISESIANFGAIVSLLLAIYSFFYERR